MLAAPLGESWSILKQSFPQSSSSSSKEIEPALSSKAHRLPFLRGQRSRIFALPAGEAAGAAAQLTGAGVGESVYSVRACRDAAFRANSAAGNASAAATTEYASEMERLLNAAENDLSYAVSAINGA